MPISSDTNVPLRPDPLNLGAQMTAYNATHSKNFGQNFVKSQKAVNCIPNWNDSNFQKKKWEKLEQTREWVKNLLWRVSN